MEPRARAADLHRLRQPDAAAPGRCRSRSGPTKLCLSCHDGTIAMGAVVNPAGGIPMAGGGTLPPGSLADFGLDLSGHHPVSFSYNDARCPTPSWRRRRRPSSRFGGADEVHCIDLSRSAQRRVRQVPGQGQPLLGALHHAATRWTGWAGSAHATSTDVGRAASLPRPPKTWPTWTRIARVGLRGLPHAALRRRPPSSCCNFTDASAERRSAAPAPAATVGSARRRRGRRRGGRRRSRSRRLDAGEPRADIARQVSKISAHHESAACTPGCRAARGTGSARSRIDVASAASTATIRTRRTTSRRELPYVSGLLRGRAAASTATGRRSRRATYEYEICFRCHGDNTADAEFVPRVVGEHQHAPRLRPDNPSFHPVVEMGRGVDVPSLPSALAPRMTPVRPDRLHLLPRRRRGRLARAARLGLSRRSSRERYETVERVGESYESYALCYRCHEREQHPRATRASAPTRVPHDPLRRRPQRAPRRRARPARPATIRTASRPAAARRSATGDHTHLINFDTRIVAPLAGADLPVFKDTGSRSGSCTLTCHGVDHLQTAYP